MPILCKPDDKRLRQRSVDIEFDSSFDIVKKLRLITHNPPWGSCVGMAAPQIGISKRVFVALDKVYINPTIQFRSKGLQVHSEGCYSTRPGKYIPVSRHETIRIRYMTEFGQYRTDTLHGMEARVVQHEFDHLNGIVIGV